MTEQELDEKLKLWGKAKRRINGTPPQPKSLSGRLMTEGAVGAAIRSSRSPEPLEVMLKEALEVSRAIRTALDLRVLKEDQHKALYIHYVIWGPSKKKAERLGMELPSYYSFLNAGRKTIRPFIIDIAASC